MEIWKWVRRTFKGWGIPGWVIVGLELIRETIGFLSDIDFVLGKWNSVSKMMKDINFTPLLDFINAPSFRLYAIVLGFGLILYAGYSNTKKVQKAEQNISYAAKPPNTFRPEATAKPPTARLPPLSAIPIPPLFEISSLPRLAPNGQVLFVDLENTSNKPLAVMVSIDVMQVWSVKQKRFVDYSTLPTKTALKAPKILEPDIPVSIRLLAVQEFPRTDRKTLKLPVVESSDISSPIIHQGMLSTLKKDSELQTDIYLVILKIESENRNKVDEIFIKWEKEQLQLVDDPSR